ncbi:MAG: M56 family metallopeptidase [Bacteroidales bacterium]
MNHLNEWMLANLFLVAVWISYELGFKRLRLFQANRFYLLGGTLLAVILPWLPWHFELGRVPGPLFPFPLEEGLAISNNPAIATEVTTARGGVELLTLIPVIWSILIILQVAVVLTVVIRLSWRTWAGRVTRQDGIRIVEGSTNGSAFSFFRTIYFPGPFDLSKPEALTILEHEKVHIRQWHSVDNLLMLTIRVLFFYNPAAHLLAARISLVHEYIADEAASRVNRSDYSRILVGHQFMVPGFILAHPFNKKSYLKQRLTMLIKKTQNRSAGWSYLLAIPVIAGMILLSGWSASAQDQAKKSKEEIAKMAVEKELTKAGFSKADIDEIKGRIDGVSKVALGTPMPAGESKPRPTFEGKDVFLIVEEMPKFEGGNLESFRFWVGKNVKYPEAAKTAGIQGTVFVSFIVKPDGTVGGVEIVRSDNPVFNDEVIRAIKSSPVWEPGRQRGEKVNVAFTIPVKFQLGN